MAQSPERDRLTDDQWLLAFELVERALKLPASERRGFCERATLDSPSLLEVTLTLLEEEQNAPAESTPIAARNRRDRFGRYVIESQLGAGGMGEVFSALDTELERAVALKFLPEDVASEPGAVDRLVREAKAASALNHPHIVTIFDVVHSGNEAAIAMELVEGQSLRTFCGRSQSPNRVAEWGRQVASALAAAHEKEIVHRDIKPENIMIRKDGLVKVVDFGLARQLGSGGRASTTAFRHAATIRYSSPEQARGERAIPGSDVFALGIVLYEALTGQHPFKGESPLETLHAITSLTPVAVDKLDPTIPSALASVVNQMIEKPAGLRPAAAEVERRLRDYVTPAVSHVVSPAAKKRSRKWLWIAAASAACIVAATAGLAVWRSRLQLQSPDLPQVDTVALTTWPSENRVRAAAVSPDGRSLAYSTLQGDTLVRNLSDGVDRPLGLPKGWTVQRIAWYADGSRVLISADNAELQSHAIWCVFTASASSIPVRITENALEGVPSPDGKRIAFLSDRAAEVWVSGAGGESPRMLHVAGASASYAGLNWSSDGLRLYCSKRVIAKQSDSSFESFDSRTGAVIASAPGLFFESASSLADGRLLVLEGIARKPDPAAHFIDWHYQLTELRTDPQTGRLLGPPKPLLTFPWETYHLSASKDGKLVAAILHGERPTVYMTDYVPGPVPRLINPRRSVVFDAPQYVHAWLPDNRSIVFESVSPGSSRSDVYLQKIDESTAVELVATDRNEFLPQVSPDGQWILYRSDGKTAEDTLVMRVRPTGGAPGVVPIAGTPGEFRCSATSAGRCVIRVLEADQFVFHELDPVSGTGAALARTSFQPPWLGDWDISPDGTEVAIPNHSARDAAVRVVPLKDGQREHTIAINGHRNINGLTWAQDGRGWYMKFIGLNGLYYLDRAGKVAPVEGSLDAQFPVVSPDGRHVALAQQMRTSNVFAVRNYNAESARRSLSR